MPVSTEAAEASPLPSLPKRFGMVFFAPGPLFSQLKERPVWIGAVLLGVALTLLANTLLPVELWEQQMREATVGGDGPGLTNAELAGVALGLKWGLVGSGLFLWPLVVAAIAGVITVIFGILLGDDGTFKRYMSVVAHAALILAVGSALLVPLKIAQSDLSTSLHLGLFFPFVEGLPAGLLRGFDLFNLGFAAVVAIGLNRIDERRSVLSSFAILVVLQTILAVPAALLVGA